MGEELRIAFSKKEKVELFLANLDKLKAEGSIEEALYQDLKAEYAVLQDDITSSIKLIKAELRKEFDRKLDELEALQKEHDLWEARFSVGEIRAEAYRRQTKPLRTKVEQLKKEVPRLRLLVSATSSAELGGPTRVDIPELKIKKSPPKLAEREDRSQKPKAAAVEKAASIAPAATSRKVAPSKDAALVSELLKDTAKTTAPVVRRNISAAEKAYTGERVAEEKRDRKYPAERKDVTSGARAAIIVVAALIIVVVVFVVGRALTSPEDRTAPLISGVSTSATGTDVTIEWATNEKATSQVILHSPEGESISTEPDKTLVDKHSVKVSGVKAGIKYSITLKSVDTSGNEAVYEMEQTLILGAQVDLAPPVISNATVSDITDTGAAITWKTDKPATSQVMVGEAGSKNPYLTEPVVNLDTNHLVILFNLKPNITYNFTLISKDANGNQAMSDLGTMFTTPSSFPVGPEVGKRAPDFTLQTIDGKSLTLSSFRGETVMVSFWQKSCPACVREMSLKQSFWEKSSRDGLVILAVNAGENAGDVQDFVERWNITFPVILDLQKKVVADYGVSGTPVTFLVDSQGIIKVIKNEAFTSSDDIANAINSMRETGGSQ